MRINYTKNIVSNKWLLITLTILFIIMLFNIFRFVSFLFFPNSNRTQTTKEILDYIHYEVFFQYLSWFCYLVFFVILIYINLTQTKNLIFKIIITAILLFIIYLPLMPIINIINIVLLLSLNNPPFLLNVNDEFKLNIKLEQNYKEITNEYIKYNEQKKVDCFRYNNPLLSNIDTIDTDNDYCWRMLYLKKAGSIVDGIIPYFPKTIEFLKDDIIHNAFFSILDPHVEIKPHIGPYKGYLRYHLGLIIPEENGKKPYIICGNQYYEWEEGKGVVFDDMFVHYVNNPTNKKRVVLFFDIKRKNLNKFLSMLCDSGIWLSENSYIYNLYIKNQHISDKLVDKNK